MSSYWLLQKYSAYIVRLTLMILVMGGRWPYSSSFEECCFENLLKTARRILLLFSSSFFLMRLVHPYDSTDTTTAWKKSSFILWEWSDLHVIDNLSLSVDAFAWFMLTSLSIDEILLPSYVNWSITFRSLPVKMEIAPCSKHMNFAFLWC